MLHLLEALRKIIPWCFHLSTRYFFPFMVVNVNSFRTATDIPQSMVQRQRERALGHLLSCCCPARQTVVRHKGLHKAGVRFLQTPNTQRKQENQEKEIVAQVLDKWTSSSIQFAWGSSSSSNTTGANHNTGIARFKHPTSNSGNETAVSISSPTVAEENWSYLPRRLVFCGCAVPLPTNRMFRNHQHLSSHVSTIKMNNDSGNFSRLSTTRTAELVRKFQARVRAHQATRRALRRIEFTAWLNDCRTWRTQLSLITAVFALIVAACVLIVCILLSAAFTLDECIVWATAVCRSLLMQILVTDPIFGMLMLCLKLLEGWVLLCWSWRCGTRRKAQANNASVSSTVSTLVSLARIRAVCAFGDEHQWMMHRRATFAVSLTSGCNFV